MLATPTQFHVEQRELTGVLYWLWNCCGKIFIYCIWPISPKCKLANLWHTQGGKRERQAQVSWAPGVKKQDLSPAGAGLCCKTSCKQSQKGLGVKAKMLTYIDCTICYSENLSHVFHLFSWGFSPFTCFNLPLSLILAEYKLSFNIRTMTK